MEELKMTGNCLKGSRPLLSFDENFDKSAPHQLMKELLVQMFGTPNHHPKSQPFVDHVMTFTLLDNRVWFRNFQIVEESGALAEVGPRFALNPIKIFDGSFTGACIWSNTHYVSPNLHRRQLAMAAAGKYKKRVEDKAVREWRQPGGAAYADNDPHGDVFDTQPPEVAKGPLKDVFQRKRQ